MFKGWSIDHLVGKKFNRLTIIEDLGKIGAARYCRVICECGNVKDIRLSAVKDGTTKSCGCLILEFNSKKIKDISHLVGKKFHRLTISEILESENGKKYCMALCECGNLRKHEVASLQSGGTKSCGCLRMESNLTGDNRRTHGLIKHPLYQVWNSIKDRCYCTSDAAYSNYGGVGVRMCEEWKNDFKAFYNWAIGNGWEKGLDIDKDKLSPYKTGKLYCPKYCCFLTRKENMMYRSNSILLNYKGKIKSLPRWCDELKLSINLMRGRLQRGWSANRAFTTPVLENRRNKQVKNIN